MATKTRIVIVGGGAAGASIAQSLSKQTDPSRHELILINPRPFDVWLIALLRTAVTEEGNLESLETGVLTPYDRLWTNGNGSLKVGTVTGIEGAAGSGGVIHLASGEAISYDVLVLAPGSVWEGPLDLPPTKAEIDAHFGEWRRRFKNAKSVVIAGGGAVGIELAGELKDFYPNKPVTIVRGGDALLNKTYPDKFRTRAGTNVTDRGVDILYNDYIDEFSSDFATPDGYVTTRHGKKIKADLVVPTRGGRPNTGFLNGSEIPINEYGQIRVEHTLQIKGFRNVFAAGDATDIREQKQAAKYPAHITIVVANILSLLSGTEPSKKHKPSTEMIAITNGKNGGMAYFNVLWGIVLGNWFVRLVKAKDLFVGRHRKDLGY